MSPLDPMSPVTIRTLDGRVAELHGLDPFEDRLVTAPEVWVLRPIDDAVVLGSRQPLEVVDAAACDDAGFAVVRRRSGGGAVLVRRRQVVWIDVVAPHGIGPDDVRGSMEWIGACWAEAIDTLVDGEIVVHRGAMVATDWSDVVCFAGIGPGEVLVDGRKFVGLSQRRSRHGIRVQGMFHLAPTTAPLCSVLRTPLPLGVPAEHHDLPGIAPGVVARRLAAALGRRR
jgi:lipoate-protein ligase A